MQPLHARIDSFSAKSATGLMLAICFSGLSLHCNFTMESMRQTGFRHATKVEDLPRWTLLASDTSKHCDANEARAKQRQLQRGSNLLYPR